MSSCRLKKLDEDQQQREFSARRHGYAGEKYLDPLTGWLLVMRRGAEGYDVVTAYAANGHHPITAPMMAALPILAAGSNERYAS